VSNLLRTTDRCAELSRSGVLDRGAAAEIITASNIEVGALRWTNATMPGSGLPDPAVLDAWLRESWGRYLGLLEVPAGMLDDSPVDLPGLVGYHLHNYAAFLASHTDDEGDLHAGARLFEQVVIPARREFALRTRSTEPLRRSLQLGSRATTALAGSATKRGDLASAQSWARLGLGWILMALRDADTQKLLAAPTEVACRFALVAAPALVVAVELDVAELGTTEPRRTGFGRTDRESGGSSADGQTGPDTVPNADPVSTAEELVELVRTWERTVGSGGAHHARHAEVNELEQRLTALRLSRHGMGSKRSS
jgi:hypothetical protein